MESRALQALVMIIWFTAGIKVMGRGLRVRVAF